VTQGGGHRTGNSQLTHDFIVWDKDENCIEVLFLFFSHINMAPLKNRWKKKAVQKRLLAPVEPFMGPAGSIVWGRIVGHHWWPGMG
jgi:hypothetical protein